jgi:hypothetical protein
VAEHVAVDDELAEVADDEDAFVGIEEEGRE